MGPLTTERATLANAIINSIGCIERGSSASLSAVVGQELEVHYRWYLVMQIHRSDAVCIWCLAEDGGGGCSRIESRSHLVRVATERDCVWLSLAPASLRHAPHSGCLRQVRPVLLQSPRARDLGGVEILPPAMADQLALLGLGEVLARAGASPAEGVEVIWGRSDDGPHRYRTLHVDRLALRREALVEAMARGAEIRSVVQVPALSASRGEWVDCAGQHFFAALDATGRRAIWAHPVERLGRT